MSPHDQERLKSIVADALSLPAESRDASLRAACGDDAALLAEARSLLTAAERADGQGFLSSPTADIPGTADHPLTAATPITERPGTIIGPYKLLQQIGEGGFGTVFMAEQSRPIHRRVALKVVKLGMDTKAVIARFEAERQALAMMDHPNIASVLDAGATDTGRPYFVMELVKGEPITEYADRHKLDIDTRLKLFMQVCQAVQHAHLKGVIHRDLKPSNVLVSTQDGQPFAKVIDFGIAKATSSRLTEKTLFTEFHQFIGTPQYMSPEQADGNLDVDTRSDVYSLGVLLYELLTGQTPFDAKQMREAAYDEIARMIREVEPPKPSTRLSTMSSSPSPLAGEGRGGGQPSVEPQPLTLATLATARATDPLKLVKQIRGELDWLVMKAMEKERSRRYETPSELARDVGRYLEGTPIEAAPPSWSYRLRKYYRKHRFALTATAVVLFVALAGFTGTSIGLWREAKARDRAEQQTQKAEASRLETERVAARLSAAVDFVRADLLSPLSPDKFPEPAIRAQIIRRVLDPACEMARTRAAGQKDIAAQLLDAMAICYLNIGEFEKARSLIAEALTLASASTDKDSDLVTCCLIDYSGIAAANGDFKSAVEFAEQATQSRLQTLPADHAHIVDALITLGYAYNSADRIDAAASTFKDAWQRSRRIKGVSDPTTILGKFNYAHALWRQGHDRATARTLTRECVKEYQRLPHQKETRLLEYLNNLAAMTDSIEESLSLAKAVMDRRRALLTDAHPQTRHSMEKYATLLIRTGNLAAGEALLADTIKANAAKTGGFDANGLSLRASYAECLLKMHKAAEARDVLEVVLNNSTSQTAADADVWYWKSILAESLANLQQYERANELFEEALKNQRAMGEDNADALTTKRTYAQALCDQGKLPKAETLGRDALGQTLKNSGVDNPSTLAALAGYARILGQCGNRADAIEECRVALRKASSLQSLGKSHYLTREIASILHGLLIAAGEVAEAEAIQHDFALDPEAPISAPPVAVEAPLSEAQKRESDQFVIEVRGKLGQSN